MNTPFTINDSRRTDVLLDCFVLFFDRDMNAPYIHTLNKDILSVARPKPK